MYKKDILIFELLHIHSKLAEHSQEQPKGSFFNSYDTKV